MAPGIVITPAAKPDIAGIIDWYEAIYPVLSADFEVAFDATLEKIVHYPQSYPVIARGMRRARLKRFPYNIYYRPEKGIVYVHAVLHTSRNPKIWQTRRH